MERNLNKKNLLRGLLITFCVLLIFGLIKLEDLSLFTIVGEIAGALGGTIPCWALSSIIAFGLAKGRLVKQRGIMICYVVVPFILLSVTTLTELGIINT